MLKRILGFLTPWRSPVRPQILGGRLVTENYVSKGPRADQIYHGKMLSNEEAAKIKSELYSLDRREQPHIQRMRKAIANAKFVAPLTRRRIADLEHTRKLNQAHAKKKSVKTTKTTKTAKKRRA